MCRQLIAPAEWDLHGGWALGDRMEWSNRACGLASLRMILLAYRRQAPTVTELLKLAVKNEVLTPRGALHAGIASLATDLGVPATAEPVPVEELLARLDAAPVIVSVTEQFPDDGRSGGHLVILRGYEDGPDPAIFIRDPSAWGQVHERIPLSRLSPSYTGRAIIFAPLNNGES
ncbi:C39 family peptidase [Streptomyces geranii]|uniref:C39 family peptidase n=1 Tax=Streptomyces geranii TaxID=2058923 RepID=UPI000D028AC4|nr:C39 family peptidase [Streptomyces geranii]